MPLPRAHQRRLERRALYKEIFQVSSLILGIGTCVGFVYFFCQLLAALPGAH